MSRSAMLTLRVLAIGSGLTILACHVANRQKQATAAAGDRGPSGASGGVPAQKKVHAPGSKSMEALDASDAARITEGLPAPKLEAPATPEVRRLFQKALGYYDLGHFPEAAATFRQILALAPGNAAARKYLDKCVSPDPVPASSKTRIMSTKSAIMISPGDVQQAARLLPPPDTSPPPRFAPGSKSAAVVSPADVQQLQQRAAPAQQTNKRQQ